MATIVIPNELKQHFDKNTEEIKNKIYNKLTDSKEDIKGFVYGFERDDKKETDTTRYIKLGKSITPIDRIDQQGGKILFCMVSDNYSKFEKLIHYFLDYANDKIAKETEWFVVPKTLKIKSFIEDVEILLNKNVDANKLKQNKKIFEEQQRIMKKLQEHKGENKVVENINYSQQLYNAEGKLNINLASEQDIMGHKKRYNIRQIAGGMAKNIIKHRTSKGPFKSVGNLLEVRMLSSERYKSLSQYVFV